ncbi:Integrin alpha-6 [Bagarius yarrelli]|uniref:Integrin alpha-6 n=1 Tax=Bagarius yarrelli TaxID=175774 RepID=A0A556U4R9_BAGYA|nr:Integrin alpha-6 [Bagarius yarrelli]
MGISGLWISRNLWISLSLILWGGVNAFNLDTINALRKNGDPGSLFGFSLALHRQLQPVDKRVLLIGAPRAKALSNQGANITGGLYSCDITNTDDCNRIEFDNDADLRVESKENQWMGVTVQSQGPGGKIVTCAHRYQRRLFVNTPQESRDITGRCYVLSQDFSIDSQSDEDGGNWKFCEGRARGHERFGACQQGLAATFTNDYHYVIFGAPGAYNWKGIVRVEQKNNTLLEMGFYDDGPYEVGDESRLDPELVPVPANSYLGFSLASGHNITEKGKLIVVSGAPRANHSGAVVLLRKEGEVSTMLSPEYVLEGPGLASSFGYAVAVVDLNGDGWQDIVVGAPQFFQRDGEVGGAVYVYINKAGKWSAIVPTRLNGTKDSMFGLAVENIGDINLDLYEDIAVGAPYADGGSGRVYIYHGSAYGINIKPAQILEGKHHGVNMFGYSLAGKMDLDYNSYPDLAVGSLSDAVFVYRARPVINIKKEIKVTPKEIDLTKKTCGNSICLNIEVCFTYKANPVTYSPKLTISYMLETESQRRKQGLHSRVSFLDKKPTDQDFQSTGTLELRGQNKKSCHKVRLRLQENIKDKLRAIPIEVSCAIESVKKGKGSNSLPELVPVQGSSLPIKTSTEFRVAKPSQVYFGGNVRGESAMKSEEEVGSLIEYEFRVMNLGKPLKSYGTAFINIQWPKESAVGKWLLYLVKVTSKGLEQITCLPENEINPNGLIEDYASYNYLDLIVKASISLDVSAKNIVLKNPETQVRLTIFPENTVAQYGGVPWWIILVAVLAGILMLALLVLLLWKCGFFKRSKYDDSIPKYHAVRIRKESRHFTDESIMFDPFEKKQWMTVWSENESYS